MVSYCKHSNDPFGFTKHGAYFTGKQLSGSEEGLWSMQLLYLWNLQTHDKGRKEYEHR